MLVSALTLDSRLKKGVSGSVADFKKIYRYFTLAVLQEPPYVPIIDCSLYDPSESCQGLAVWSFYGDAF